MRNFFKHLILMWFAELYEEEIDNAEPEVNKFLAKMLEETL